jgi:hypothetical protein
VVARSPSRGIAESSMSAKGQTRRFDDVRVMSAFHLIATEGLTSRNVSNLPGAASCTAATYALSRSPRRPAFALRRHLNASFLGPALGNMAPGSLLAPRRVFNTVAAVEHIANNDLVSLKRLLHSSARRDRTRPSQNVATRVSQKELRYWTGQRAYLISMPSIPGNSRITVLASSSFRLNCML